MTDFISYIVQGLPIGCVFALVAVGLVLTYKTSGVFNLAFGAQAFVAAVLFYELRVRNGWSTPAAFAVVAAWCVAALALSVRVVTHRR